MSSLGLVLVGILSGMWQGPGSDRAILTLHVSIPFDFLSSNNVPDFVLYHGRSVIYQLEDSVPPADETHATYPRFVLAKLDSATFAGLVGLATSDSFLALKPHYDLDPQVTDLSVNVIRVWADHSDKRVMVRGDGSRGPPSFAALFKRVHGFRYPGARPWLPDSIEVQLTRIDRPCVHSDSIAWPAELAKPYISPDSSVVRYMVPVRELPKVEALRRAHAGWACTPVSIEASSWWISYRYPFPGDSAWSTEYRD